MPLSPFLAPERDNALKPGRSKAASTYWTIPGYNQVSAASDTLTANEVRYYPFFVQSPIRVDQMCIEVSTNAGTNARFGFYAADTDWQPIGAPQADSGNVATGTTGVKTYTPGTPLYIPRGRYVSCLNADGAPGVRVITGTINGMPSLVTTLGATPVNNSFSATQTFGAFPTPGTAWDTVNLTAVGAFRSSVFYRIVSP